MLTIIFAVIYNVLFFPLFFVLAHVAALVNAKVRRGVLGRYRSRKALTRFSRQQGRSAPRLLIHCASMGEFEHIKPFISSFKRRLPRSSIVVMFFSPSGYENVRLFYGVDFIMYSPFDWWLPVLRTFKKLKPSALIIAKHDVWPNQIWIANLLSIPCALINASLHDRSRRLQPILRFFHQAIYQGLQKIITISEKDANNYKKLVSAEKITIAGDTKYEQVIMRMEESKKNHILPRRIVENRRVFIAGSIWQEDARHLIPAIKDLMREHDDLLVIVCPHEPTAAHIDELREAFAPITACLYSDISNYRDEPLIIIDRIGLLANLYSLAQVAYVGGSFKQNVHNVLEPAVYGIPVLFGPVNQNSHEAQLLKQSGGGIEVHSADEIRQALAKFLSDEFYRKKIGACASKVVTDNTGATQRTIDAIGTLSGLKVGGS